MKNTLIIILFGLLAATCCSCNKDRKNSGYIQLVEELHSIECSELRKGGISFTVNDTNIYTFRGLAFDRIMTKDPDARLIYRYGIINQQLAAMEYEMDENEKEEYRDYVKTVYLKTCR